MSDYIGYSISKGPRAAGLPQKPARNHRGSGAPRLQRSALLALVRSPSARSLRSPFPFRLSTSPFPSFPPFLPVPRSLLSRSFSLPDSGRLLATPTPYAAGLLSVPPLASLRRSLTPPQSRKFGVGRLMCLGRDRIGRSKITARRCTPLPAGPLREYTGTAGAVSQPNWGDRVANERCVKNPRRLWDCS